MTPAFSLRRPPRVVLATWLVASLGAALLVAMPGEAHAATTYYVDPNGRNSAPGTSDRPFRNIGYGITQLEPGDTLIVRGNKNTPYVENIGDKSSPYPRKKWYRPGTASARITVKAQFRHRPWIRGVLHVRGADYWTFRGINVQRNRNSPAPAKEGLVKFMDGVGWEFRAARIEGANGYAGLYIGDGPLAGPRNWKLVGNCISKNSGTTVASGQAHNLYVAAGLNNSGGLVTRNILFGAPKGFNVKVGVGGNMSNGTSRVTLKYNTMFSGHSNVAVTGKSNNIAMVRNLLGRTGTLATGVRHQSWYPNIRPYKLSGGRNVAKYNRAFESQYIIKGARGDGTIKGSRNIKRARPKFNNVRGCTGFKPSPKVPYGRYG